MGNSLGAKKRPRTKAERELERWSRPTGLYPSCKWDDETALQMIVSGRIAPRFPGSEQGGPGMDECPICFLHYRGGLNHTKCCGAELCSECLLQVSETSGGNRHWAAICPFCNHPDFTTEYRGAKTAQERHDEQIEEQSTIAAQIKASQIGAVSPLHEAAGSLGDDAGADGAGAGSKSRAASSLETDASPVMYATTADRKAIESTAQRHSRAASVANATIEAAAHRGAGGGGGGSRRRNDTLHRGRMRRPRGSERVWGVPVGPDREAGARSEYARMLSESGRLSRRDDTALRRVVAHHFGVDMDTLNGVSPSSAAREGRQSRRHNSNANSSRHTDTMSPGERASRQAEQVLRARGGVAAAGVHGTPQDLRQLEEMMLHEALLLSMQDETGSPRSNAPSVAVDIPPSSRPDPAHAAAAAASSISSATVSESTIDAPHNSITATSMTATAIGSDVPVDEEAELAMALAMSLEEHTQVRVEDGPPIVERSIALQSDGSPGNTTSSAPAVAYSIDIEGHSDCTECSQMGLILDNSPGADIVVAGVIPHSRAYRAVSHDLGSNRTRIQENDVLTHVNGISLCGLPFDEVLKLLGLNSADNDDNTSSQSHVIQLRFLRPATDNAGLSSRGEGNGSYTDSRLGSLATSNDVVQSQARQESKPAPTHTVELGLMQNAERAQGEQYGQVQQAEQESKALDTERSDDWLENEREQEEGEEQESKALESEPSDAQHEEGQRQEECKQQESKAQDSQQCEGWQAEEQGQMQNSEPEEQAQKETVQLQAHEQECESKLEHKHDPDLGPEQDAKSKHGFSAKPAFMQQAIAASSAADTIDILNPFAVSHTDSNAPKTDQPDPAIVADRAEQQVAVGAPVAPAATLPPNSAPNAASGAATAPAATALPPLSPPSALPSPTNTYNAT